MEVMPLHVDPNVGCHVFWLNKTLAGWKMSISTWQFDRQFDSLLSSTNPQGYESKL